MTKKDYEAIAKAIHDTESGDLGYDTDYQAGHLAAKLELAVKLAVIFAEDNPNFDRKMFLQACGWKPALKL